VWKKPKKAAVDANAVIVESIIKTLEEIQYFLMAHKTTKFVLSRQEIW